MLIIISNEIRSSIVTHVKDQHQKQLSIDFGFNELLAISSHVFSKLRGKLLHELSDAGYLS